MKGNEPNALLFNMKNSFGNANEQLKPALAASLFKSRVLSLGAAAKVSGLNLSDFLIHLSELEIYLVIPDNQTSHELNVLESWLS